MGTSIKLVDCSQLAKSYQTVHNRLCLSFKILQSLKSGGEVDNNDGTASPGKRDSVSTPGKKSKKASEESRTPESPETLHDGNKRGSISAGLKKSRKSTDEQLQKPLIKVEAAGDNKQENTTRKSQDSSNDQLLKPTLATFGRHG